MSLEVPESALRIRRTLDHYSMYGLEDTVLCGGSALYWQLAIATGPQIDRLPVKLCDIDALAPYISIRALHTSIEADDVHIVTEWRERQKQGNAIRDRATLKVELADSQDGIMPLQAFTGVETDRISVTHDVVSKNYEAMDIQGIACLPIAQILAWKVLADRPKDREQVAAYISFIRETRAVSYDEWDSIQTATKQAQRRLWTIKNDEYVRWSGSG